MNLGPTSTGTENQEPSTDAEVEASAHSRASVFRGVWPVNRLRRWLGTESTWALYSGRVLSLTGQGLMVCAIAVLLTAWQTATDKGKPNLALLVAAAGLAMLVTGIFMMARRRRDLVEKLLTGLTAASFAIGLAVASAADPATSAEKVFGTFQPALFFAAWLFLGLALRDGYRGAHIQGNDG